MDGFEIKGVIFSTVSANDYKKIILLADKIWKKSFEEILPPERVEYLYNFMYGGDTVKKQIESGEQEYFIIENENIPAGYVSISNENERIFKLNKLYLLHELHGKGLATAIMDNIVSIIKSRGGKNIILTVNRANARAVRFYEKYGFIITGQEDFDVGGGHVMDDYIMELKLD